MIKFDLEGWRAFALKRFGPSVKILSQRKRPGVRIELCIKVGKDTGWVTSDVLHNRKQAQSLLAKPAQLKKTFKARHRDLAIEAATKELSDKLSSWGLGEITFEIITLSNYRFCYKGFYFDLGATHFRNNTKTRRAFLCRLFAKKRFNSNIPLAHSDKEWAAKVGAASGGRLTSEMYFPPSTGLPQRLRCLRCDTVFDKRRPFNKSNPVLSCPKCDKRQSKNYSKKAVAWLKDLEERLSIKITHAESPRGEHSIKLPNGERTCVDGFHKGIVFEYHGSRWHGNPSIFYLDELPNPYSKATALQLLMKTFKREKAIQESGYRLIRIWDTDFLHPERYNSWLLKNLKLIRQHLSTKR